MFVRMRRHHDMTSDGGHRSQVPDAYLLTLSTLFRWDPRIVSCGARTKA